jgi:hypothetical protein
MDKLLQKKLNVVRQKQQPEGVASDEFEGVVTNLNEGEFEQLAHHGTCIKDDGNSFYVSEGQVLLLIAKFELLCRDDLSPITNSPFVPVIIFLNACVTLMNYPPFLSRTSFDVIIRGDELVLTYMLLLH